jgi:hypothetical protein
VEALDSRAKAGEVVRKKVPLKAISNRQITANNQLFPVAGLGNNHHKSLKRE